MRGEPDVTGCTRTGDRSTGHTYYAATRSICRVCKRGVEAKVLFRGDEVWLDKFCPEHGKQKALLASSVGWYLDALTFLALSRPPQRAERRVERGCPFDCGPCGAHQQAMRLPVIPITSACNLDCPICYTVNRNEDAFFLDRDGMAAILERLRGEEGAWDIINFTGGEPTLHPDLPAFLEMCRESGIRRLTVSTNGLKLLDEDYVRQLAALGTRIVLSFDTFDPQIDRVLLGADTVQAKLRVIDLLNKHAVPTTILPAIGKGLNDRDIPRLLDLVLETPNILSLELHPITFTGQGGAGFPRRARTTIPDLHRAIERATRGRIAAADFVPSPLAHPLCYSICYVLLLDGGGFVPLARLSSRARLFDLLRDTLYIEPHDALEDFFRDLIFDLWANPERLPDAPRILATLRRLLGDMFPEAGTPLSIAERLRIAERSVKAIYIHAHMDEETFDVSRVMKCCVAVPEPDGTTIPTCSYNVLYREKDRRFAAPETLRSMGRARSAELSHAGD
jgi:uncharacterized radical SAM superfamily Fe-S cluster-containing enzyme